MPDDLEALVVHQGQDVVLGSGEEVVDAQHVAAFGQQPAAQVRADESGPAGHHQGLGERHDRPWGEAGRPPLGHDYRGFRKDGLRPRMAYMKAMNAPTPHIAEAPPRWSLDDLYAGRDDPRIEADLAAAEAADARAGQPEGRLRRRPRRRRRRWAALIDRGIALYEAGHQRAVGRRRLRVAWPPRPPATTRPGPSSRPTCAPAARRSPPRACSSPWSSTSSRTTRSRRPSRAAPAGRALAALAAARAPVAAARAVARPGADADRPRRRRWPTGAGSTTRPWPR